MKQPASNGRLQFNIGRMLGVVALLCALCASGAAIPNAAPASLFTLFLVTQVIHVGLLLGLSDKAARRGCVLGVITGAIASTVLFLVGGIAATASLLPFFTKGNSLEPFVATWLGVLLTSGTFSLFAGSISASIRLLWTPKRPVGIASLFLLLVWLFLASLAVDVRGPRLQVTAEASGGHGTRECCLRLAQTCFHEPGLP